MDANGGLTSRESIVRRSAEIFLRNVIFQPSCASFVIHCCRSFLVPILRATCCRTNERGTLQLLLDYGANPEAKDQTRRTPLHRASRWGSPECVLLLLDAGADIEVGRPVVRE